MDGDQKQVELRFNSLEIERDPPLAYLYLNRPFARNALSLELFEELRSALSALDRSSDVHVIVFSGRGKHFCSGIDVSVLGSISASPAPSDLDQGWLHEHLRRRILSLQSAVSALERCRKPVVAEIHGACVGAGVDLVTACDLRYCTEEAMFSVKEVDMAITADLGTLQRLPRIVGAGRAADMALTGRSVSGREAAEIGLVSGAFRNQTELQTHVRAVSKEIARKSSLALIGIKDVLLKSRDLSLAQGLDYVATWNSGMLLSNDLTEAMSAFVEKRKPKFSKL